MNSLRKVNKVLVITLIVFSIGVFANYSKTASKYWISDKSDRISNSVVFKSLTRNFPPNYDSPSKEVVWHVPFYRTVAHGDNSVKSDVIKFETDSVCNIIEIKGFNKNGNKNSYVFDNANGDKNGNVVTFTYTDVTSNSYDDIKRNSDGTIAKDSDGKLIYENVPSNVYVEIVYSCTAKDLVTTVNGKKVLETNFKAIEKIDQEHDFKYFGGTYRTDEYIEPIPYEISTDKTKLTITDPSVKLSSQALTDWITQYITKYYNTSNSTGAIRRALNSYLVLATLSNEATANSIKGVKYNATEKSYTFEKDVVNLALTKYFISTYTPKRLYFFNPDVPSEALTNYTAEEVDLLFAYYYDSYFEENAEITDYIASKGGVSEVVVNNGRIPGVKYMDGYVTIDEDIIYSQIHPVDETLTKSTNDIVAFMTDISGRVNYYIKNVLKLPEVDSALIEKNRTLSSFFNTYLYNNTNLNTYFYVVLDNCVLSMRVYYDSDNANYKLHIEKFDFDNELDKTAEAHIFTMANKNFKTSTDANDSVYTLLREKFGLYVSAVNSTYGTDFSSVAPQYLNAVITALVTNVTNGKPNATYKMEEHTITETVKGQILSYGYDTISTSAYGTVSIKFAPSDDLDVSTQSVENDDAQPTT